MDGWIEPLIERIDCMDGWTDEWRTTVKKYRQKGRTDRQIDKNNKPKVNWQNKATLEQLYMAKDAFAPKILATAKRRKHEKHPKKDKKHKQ